MSEYIVVVKYNQPFMNNRFFKKYLNMGVILVLGLCGGQSLSLTPVSVVPRP